MLLSLFAVCFWLSSLSLVYSSAPLHARSSLENPSLTSPLSDHIATPSPKLSTTRQNNGLTDVVEWDSYSLFLQNQRVFIWSGEFHPWRLPVVTLWLDVLQKMRAAGLNAVSIYVHWGLVNPSPGVFDFEGYRSLQSFFDAASKAGLWVVLRPGPYINAETSAGGIPHWVTTEVQGHLRTNNTAYRAAWTPYIREIARLTKFNQITEGGPVIAVQIDNEYAQDESVGWPGKSEMMREIENELRSGGIVVPLTYNDAGPKGAYVNGTGAVDIYGLDSYPQRFDCSNPGVWNPVVENYYDFHMNTNPAQPWYTPEFQGGAFDAWGPTAPGYDACRQLTNDQFESMFFKNLYASNFKLINIYMFYGGTTWGHLPEPGVYTSYDYGAPITESRQIETVKYEEIKRQAMFIRSTPAFYQTDIVGNSSSADGTVRLSGAASERVFATHLRNPDTGASFYVVRARNSTSLEPVSFGMNINTLQGDLHIPMSIPSITVPSRESLIVTSDLRFGNSSFLLYSTAEMMWSGTLGDRDALILVGSSTHWHEAMLRVKSKTSFMPTPHEGVSCSAALDDYTLVTIQPGVEGLITLVDSPEQVVLYLDKSSTTNLWLPTVEHEKNTSPLASYWQFGTNETLLVHGPHLVRKVVLQDAHEATLAMYGDLKDSVRLVVIGWPKSVKRLLWNDQPVEADFGLRAVRPDGEQIPLGPDGMASILNAELSLSSAFRGARSGITLPKLDRWSYSDSLPEIRDSFSDDEWSNANHTTTNIPYPRYDDGPVLYGCDYGYCEGIVIWRGHFETTSNTTDLTLVLNGGAAFAASIWVNEHFLATSYGNSTNNRNIVAETNETWLIPSDMLHSDRNVLTIVQDNMGLEETDGDEDADYSKSPRGIRNAGLSHGRFTSWKVQGKKGGYRSFPDKMRGVFNEGGSFAERQGWHLPDVNISDWPLRNLSDGLPDGRAGLGFFATAFDLDIPNGVDAPISVRFEDEDGPYRAFLFVNGWMMGKRVANLGPQVDFPVHEGIWNYQGTNTLAVMLWAMEPAPLSPRLSLSLKGVYDIPLSL